MKKLIEDMHRDLRSINFNNQPPTLRKVIEVLLFKVLTSISYLVVIILNGIIVLCELIGRFIFGVIEFIKSFCYVTIDLKVIKQDKDIIIIDFQSRKKLVS